jgi:hypothetical protein
MLTCSPTSIEHETLRSAKTPVQTDKRLLWVLQPQCLSKRTEVLSVPCTGLHGLMVVGLDPILRSPFQIATYHGQLRSLAWSSRSLMTGREVYKQKHSLAYRALRRSCPRMTLPHSKIYLKTPTPSARRYESHRVIAVVGGRRKSGSMKASNADNARELSRVYGTDSGTRNTCIG